MGGWNTPRVFNDGPPAAPPPAMANVAAKDGSLPLGIGVVLLLIGGVLVLLGLRNPNLDPSGMSRAPITEGTGVVVADRAGFYVAFLEDDCNKTSGATTVQFTQAGQPVAQSTPASSLQFSGYTYDGRCAGPIGLYSFTAPGDWTAASLDQPATGYIAVYRKGARPTRVDTGTLWVAGAFVVLGGGLTTFALVQRRRWRRVNESLQPPP